MGIILMISEPLVMVGALGVEPRRPLSDHGKRIVPVGG